jgi:hypothetical protein
LLDVIVVAGAWPEAGGALITVFSAVAAKVAEAIANINNFFIIISRKVKKAIVVV